MGTASSESFLELSRDTVDSLPQQVNPTPPENLRERDTPKLLF